MRLAHESEQWRFPFPSPSPKTSPLPGRRRNKLDGLPHSVQHPFGDGRSGRLEAALAIVTELAASRNPYRGKALCEMAKHYEHRESNYAMALEMTQAALGEGDTPELRKREQRLLTKTAAVRSGTRSLYPAGAIK